MGGGVEGVVEMWRSGGMGYRKAQERLPRSRKTLPRNDRLRIYLSLLKFEVFPSSTRYAFLQSAYGVRFLARSKSLFEMTKTLDGLRAEVDSRLHGNDNKGERYKKKSPLTPPASA